MQTTSILLAALVASTALLVGCDRTDPRAASEGRADVTVADKQAAETQRGESTADRQAAVPVRAAADNIGDKARDAGITAEINARLARDEALSALRINVDTDNGRVNLRGNAPDPLARERATVLARGVDGVVDVNNELQAQPRN